MSWPLILILALAASLYDLRMHRIPNWFTWPLIVVGFILHFPGHPDIWVLMVLLFLAFTSGGMGAGDVKLWAALLWLVPASSTTPILLPALVTLLVTGLAQLLWRRVKNLPVTGVSSPAAWRTIPFVLLLWYVH
jgi:Flp pilus assembly protein protease CpaA